MSIPIFIGTSPNGEDGDIERIYEYSLRKNSSQDLHIKWMQLENNSKSIWGGWNTSRWFTPFSGLRWAIPHACNFKGRAIYTDVDMINFKDINDLYTLDMEGKPFAARKGLRFGGHELCVMLIDCEKAKDLIWGLKKLKKRSDSHSYHRDLISKNPDLIKTIDPRWNCMDGEDRPLSDIYQAHFTNMSSQPWHPSWYKGVNTPHKRPDLVEKYFSIQQACNDAGVPESNIREEKVLFDILL
jgi:hypothetical protein